MSTHTTNGEWVCPDGEEVVKVIHGPAQTVIETRRKPEIKSGLTTNPNEQKE